MSLIKAWPIPYKNLDKYIDIITSGVLQVVTCCIHKLMVVTQVHAKPRQAAC